MEHLKMIFMTMALVASLGLAAPVQAELLVNEWQPFEFVLPEGNPDEPCGNDPAYLAQGMAHLKVSTLRKGFIAVNFNALGTFTGVVTGEEWLWRDNITEVIPVDGENVVYTFQNTLKIIGQGGQNTYFAKTKFHVTVIGGEVKSYIDMEEITCS